MNKRAFDYSNSTNVKYDLHIYIKCNLYDKEIAIQKEGKIIVFNWNYSPQLTGKYKQRETYQNQYIDSMVDKIINLIR
tara:strand:- start:977 stop:1210 length:234 start_codon:yes stop_codon:yes gene_type:complete